MPRLLSRWLAPRTRSGRPVARLRFEVLEDRFNPVTLAVNAAAGLKAIDPNIYGTAFATTAQLADLNLPLNRSGGNASTTYSYAQDATNRGSDWYFESIASGSGNGQGMDAWINETKAGGAKPSVTLNIFDWAAKVGAGRSILGSFPTTKYGPQQQLDPWHSEWGNGVRTNGTNVTGNDPNDAYVPNSVALQQTWVQHLIDTFGTSQNGGVQYYTMSNEPGLWNHTHRDIHPNGYTVAELRDRVIAYAAMVKTLDPGAKVLGFEEWGWTNYFIDGADSAAQNWGATYGPNGLDAQAWLLDQLHQNETATGKRLLDYFTLHFYPQAGQFGDDVSDAMQLLRNRSTRSLWDANYVDESWIASTGIDGGKVDLIRRMQQWVDTYYPGTGIGITEYNWGAEGHMNGATTQADIWGIFGREGLDLANRWTTPATGSPTYLAMKMYRNYDGNGGAFGDTSVSAAAPNPDQVAVYASTRASDGALTIMVVNKNLVNGGASTPITINLSNFLHNGSAALWQLAGVGGSLTQAAIARAGDLTITGNTITFTSPNQSVQLLVIPKQVVVPPTVTFTLTGGAVPEFRAVGTSAGTLAAASSVPRTYTYSLVAGTGSTDNAKFKIDGNKLVANAVFDAMVKSSYSIRVRATDETGGFIDKAFTITVTDSPAIAIGGRALYVNGTAGNDSFGFAAGTVNHGVSLNGTNWTIPKSLVDVAVFFGNGGSDSADLTAVGSKNAAGLAPTFGVLAGSGYEVWATGTSKLTARGGPTDVAYLAGTDGDDFLMATPTNTVLTGTGYSSTAAGFGTTVGYAGNGKDSALLMGSDGDDVFVGTPTYGALTGAGFANYAAGFDSVSASAGKGNDGAFLADSAGVDTVGGSGAMVTLTGPGFSISVDGFDGVIVYGFAGGKNKKLTAGVTAYLETPGDWTG